MYLRLLFHFLILSWLLIVQLTILPNLPWGLHYLNLILVILIFTLLLFDFNWSVGWWLASAWLLSLFGFHGFVGPLIVATINFSLIYWLLISFFTNRSLYALLFLVSLALLINDLGLYLFDYLRNLSQDWPIIKMQGGWWLLEAKKLGANLILTIILFYIFNFFSRRFRPILNK
ncbi:MAG: hypothetical protein UT42_C0023G0010 [Candidatus Falkowbacteria bacterium GW2011_GWA2_39_24]|uniref:Rod shape-determining protein MreD n=1 Tax=Candidatus Falkowbacteria bacterium GW2011_GWA2_39_24 TaxID=1618634 RepID=A0A0G0NGL1_9BACT|nr:MAG: hypothetical protein UT42_C0023G0010 [Candidatus Falkowbacteria bacterium GW2011_GWA2_39_24]